MYPERMKKFIAIFVMVVCAVHCASGAAVSVKNAGVKKAAPVATKQADKMDTATSLLPAVIGLVSNVRALNTQQQQLTADCIPTSSEVQLVNDLVKEYAKTGMVTASSFAPGGMSKCEGSFNDAMYSRESNDLCYEVFDSKADEGMIWKDFPKASNADITDDFDSKNKKNVNNVYDIFLRIPFTEEDYTEAEARKIAQLKEKTNRCAPAKVKAAQRELAGGFLVQTLGSIGQTTGAAGTASVLEAVSSMGGSGNMNSMLPSLGAMATQMLDK